MKTILAVLFLVLSVVAQVVPVNSPPAYVVSATQPGSQQFGAQVHWQATTNTHVPWLCGVQQTVHARSADAWLVTLAFHGIYAAAGSHVPAFAVQVRTAAPGWCWPIPGLAPVPGAAIGHQYLFVPAPTIILPQYSYQVFAFVMVDLFVLRIPIPADPNLLGQSISSQGFRIDPTDGLLYLSDLADGYIGS